MCSAHDAKRRSKKFFCSSTTGRNSTISREDLWKVTTSTLSAASTPGNTSGNSCFNPAGNRCTDHWKPSCSSISGSISMKRGRHREGVPGREPTGEGQEEEEKQIGDPANALISTLDFPRNKC